MKVDLVADCGASLGEGPVWDGRVDRLVWVDIERGVVHRTAPDGRDEAIAVAPAITALAPRRHGGWIAATWNGFADVSEDWQVEPLATLEGGSRGTRMNDGGCDPAGRFWAGSMALDGSSAAGSLYCMDTDGGVHRMLAPVGVSNGLCWNDAGTRLLYIDSPTGRLDAFACEPSTGRLGDRWPVATFPEAWGLPDGMALDVEGCVWIAFWGGGAVRRISPDGRVLDEIRLPVSLVTSCAFGGADWGELYITTASNELTPSQRRAQPLAGGLFVVCPSVPGTPPRAYGG